MMCFARDEVQTDAEDNTIKMPIAKLCAGNICE